MKFIKKKTMDLTEEDVALIKYISRQEDDADDTNSIRIALKCYKENKQLIQILKALLSQQTNSLEILTDIQTRTKAIEEQVF